MRIIEIAPLSNGAHRNQTIDGGYYFSKLPVGWAVVPVDTDTLPNFPFGNFDVEDVNGIPTMVVSSWEPLPMPEPEPVPEPEVEPDVWDELAEAYRQGVQSAYEQ